MKEAKIDKKIDKTVEQYRKTTTLSKKALRHIETLKHYYKVDMLKRIITIPMHYSKAEELIDTSLGDKKKPFIQRDLLAKISGLSHSIPYEFHIDIDLKIDDYQGYKHSDIAKSIVDAFEMFQYDLGKEKTLSSLKVAALVIFGVIVLAWLFYLCSKHWFGESGNPTHDTIHELVYTVGAVVLWEAIYIIFLPSHTYDDISQHILTRINSINLYDKLNKKLQVISGKSMYKYWRVDTKAEIRSRKFLLISGTALMCLAGCKLCDVVEIFIKYSGQVWSTVMAVITIAVCCFTALAGIGAISYYRDKGPFRKVVLPFGIVGIIIALGEIALASIFFKDLGLNLAVKTIVISSIIAILSAIYIGCLAMLNKKDRLSNKSDKTPPKQIITNSTKSIVKTTKPTITNPTKPIVKDPSKPIVKPPKPTNKPTIN